MDQSESSQTLTKMNAEKYIIKKSSRVCCVVGCTSRDSRNPDVKFYSFPGRPWETEHRKKWVISVRRLDVKGKLWQPNKNSKICSLHFEGGKRSEDPRQTAYYPTIFPDVYGKLKKVDLQRTQRLEARNRKLESSCSGILISEGCDAQMKSGFSGWNTIKSDQDILQLTGISQSIFNILLKFIKPKNHGQPHKEAIKESLPTAFKNYPNCRAIIDCTEIKVQTPAGVDQRVMMYSSYKSGFTIKFLIGISPSGMITFVSKGYGGR
ncbi:uncharacterized protein [Prorops nasuta]|uniref:uncharacterized protein n=1 Tax=Prorops nasuta TaxID=863751 RepID=UPI0034CEC4C5